MPKRTDIRKIMIIGSGPIQIGQAAEFDFSGSQACKAVREEGYEVVLVNSNPATIQTDVEMADQVYLEPLSVESVTRIIEKEKPDGILSGMGGQTALNLCSELAAAGVLEKHGVLLLGTQLEAIEDAEDRDHFKRMMERIGEPVPRAEVATSIDQALGIVERIGGYPVLVRPAYTLGGTGGGVAHTEAELREVCGRGLAYSRINQVLIEESVLGWREYEYEVMRDGVDNCITICNMENMDPMGIHTGESAVVAPAQTLSDQEHQRLRSSSLKIIRALNIEGGCNVQFAVDPETGDHRVIEVNPRVSRSSALASKATGYPIARVAAKIALGMTLDEIPNPITGRTFAAFEPALDYVITKIPRWPFDKFRMVDPRIGTQMKSTGEVMAIGRTIEESLLKAVRSLEVDRDSLSPGEEWTDEQVQQRIQEPTHETLWAITEAIRRGQDLDKLRQSTGWDPFFLEKLKNIVAMENRLVAQRGEDDEEPGDMDPGLLRAAKRLGFADTHIAELTGLTPEAVMDQRHRYDIRPKFNMVDTCAAEFAARTPYYYSTYDEAIEGVELDIPRAVTTQTNGAHGERDETEAPSIPGAPGAQGDDGRKCLILGSGPIRIGQGIEFDYSCVHAAWALREAGVETIMVNNNPETVSTDSDTSDRLYFDPLTLEDVLEIIEHENPDGVLVQFGGQTAINLALPLERALMDRPHLKTRIWGTPPASIDLAEDREKFGALMRELQVPQPEGGTGHSIDEVRALAAKIGYPVLLRPSYVLGGRAMEIVGNDKELERYVRDAVKVSKKHPILVDKFLGHATEVDVDAACDGQHVILGAIMEHIEEAGVHSGDSTCTIPPPNLPETIQDTIHLYTRRIARALDTKGLINIQFAVKENKVYVLEVNPRSSRTVPYVAKATGYPLAKMAARAAMGHSLQDEPERIDMKGHYAVKAPVFPFLKLPGLDTILSPEMKSTGEVMGIDHDHGRAYYKAMEAAGNRLPTEGTVFISVREEDRDAILPLAMEFIELGFDIVATRGTSAYLSDFDIPNETVFKLHEKRAPDAIDLMRQGRVKLIINTPSTEYESPERRDGYQMRRVSVEMQIPFMATLASARVGVQAIRAAKAGGFESDSLNAHHAAEHQERTPRAKRVA